VRTIDAAKFMKASCFPQRKKGIFVLRTVDGKQQKFAFNYSQVIKGEKPEQNILVRPGDTVVVP
jgi:polysaccharide export outer membrane protein